MSENERIELSKRILEGIRNAQRQLFERKARLGETVVIGDENGKPLIVPASEVLNRLNSTNTQ